MHVRSVYSSRKMPFQTSPFRYIFGVSIVLLAGCHTAAPPTVRTQTWAGTAQVRETDFDRRTWHGTSVAVVRQLMERFPDRIQSAAQHRLARNLLVSVADAPQGGTGGDALIALRVDALMRLGDLSDAATLARAAKEPPRDEASAQREIEAELLVGNIEMACIDLRALAARSSTRWVEEGLALCKARTGEAGATTPSDVDRLGALARIRGAQLSADQTPGDPPDTRTAYLVAVASDPKISAARRLEAAFGAARASAFGGQDYARLLQSAPAHGEASPGGEPPASGQQAAGLFQSIERSADPARKVALVQRGLLSPDGAVDGVSTAMVEPLRKAKPEPGNAAQFALCLYAVGDQKAAAPWAALAKRSDVTIWPYRALAKPPAPGELAEWEKRAALDPGRRERMAAILSAFGIGPEPSAESGSPADLKDLDDAATAQRSGETALRALAILGRGGPAGASPQTLHHVLKALDRVNLHDEARALAFEAMTATLLIRPQGRKGEVAATQLDGSDAHTFRVSHSILSSSS
jgi:hypothetical protein